MAATPIGITFLQLVGNCSGEEAPAQHLISLYRSRNFTVLLRLRNHGAALPSRTHLGL